MCLGCRHCPHKCIRFGAVRDADDSAGAGASSWDRRSKLDDVGKVGLGQVRSANKAL